MFYLVFLTELCLFMIGLLNWKMWKFGQLNQGQKNIFTGGFENYNYHSKTEMLFYMTPGWDGILVEPSPDAFEALKTKKRRANLFGHC